MRLSLRLVVLLIVTGVVCAGSGIHAEMGKPRSVLLREEGHGFIFSVLLSRS